MILLSFFVDQRRSWIQCRRRSVQSRYNLFLALFYFNYTLSRQLAYSNTHPGY